jgi:hypothetical protein
MSTTMGQKQTCAVHKAMSAMGQKRTCALHPADTALGHNDALRRKVYGRAL